MSEEKAIYQVNPPSADEILARLAEAYAERDNLHLEQARLNDEAIPEEVKQRLAEIAAEFMPMFDMADEKIAALEEQAKQAVLSEGKTVKSDYIQAVYQKGRVSWDSKKLEGLMMIVPQLENARTVGEPTVILRKGGKK
jgi:hypothetical protein